MRPFFKSFFVVILILCGCTELPTSTNDYHYNIPKGTVLYIYGGNNYKDYLGKINASKYDSESIWNQYSTYGSKYNAKSIWNKYGTYGNPYSTNSPFNDYASNPPILVDTKGAFYGYFTSNKYKVQRANLQLIDIICENYEAIGEDVSGWYDKIFY